MRHVLNPFELLLGSWVGLQLLIFVVLGPSPWNAILGTLAWFALLIVLLELRRRYLWRWLFPGIERPYARNR